MLHRLFVERKLQRNVFWRILKARNAGVGFLVPTLVVLGFVALVSYLALNNNFSARFNAWGVVFDTADLKLTRFAEDQTTAVKSETLEAMGDGMELHIERFLAENRAKFISDREFLFESLFEPVTSPYPEVITNVVECPEEFKPRKEVVANGTVYTLFAGARQNFGVCSRDLVKYQAAYALFDCGEKGVFEFRIFGEDDEALKSRAASFSC